VVLPSSWIIVAFWIVAIVSIVVALAIWLISRVILAPYIAIGPLLIGVAQFLATRSIHERWIGSPVSHVILHITTIVLLYIVLAVEQQVTGQRRTFHGSGAALGSARARARASVPAANGRALHLNTRAGVADARSGGRRRRSE
jgi:hypothetical protein